MKRWVKITYTYVDPLNSIVESAPMDDLDGITDPNEAKKRAWPHMKAGDELRCIGESGEAVLLDNGYECAFVKHCASKDSFSSEWVHAPRSYSGNYVYWWDINGIEGVHVEDLLDNNMNPLWIRSDDEPYSSASTGYTQDWYDKIRQNPKKCTDLGTDTGPLTLCVTARPYINKPKIFLFFRGDTVSHSKEIKRLGYQWAAPYDYLHGYILPERRMWVKIVPACDANAEIARAKAIGAQIEQKMNQEYLDEAERGNIK